MSLFEYLSKNQSYAVALVDVRGSSGRGEKVQQAISGGLGAVEAADAMQIVR